MKDISLLFHHLLLKIKYKYKTNWNVSTHDGRIILPHQVWYLPYTVAPQPQKPRGDNSCYWGVNVECDIRALQRDGLVETRPPNFGKGNMGAEGDAG